MSKSTKSTPEYHTLTPHLCVRGARKAIEFYEKAFGAEVIQVIEGPDGKVMHAGLKIGDSILMLNDEFPDWNALSPLSLNGSGVTIHVNVENVDAAFERAVAAGAKVTMPLANQFWGDRYGTLTDPFGHHWSMATKVEDLTEEEIKKRMEALFSQPQKQTC